MPVGIQSVKLRSIKNLTRLITKYLILVINHLILVINHIIIWSLILGSVQKLRRLQIKCLVLQILSLLLVLIQNWNEIPDLADLVTPARKLILFNEITFNFLTKNIRQTEVP